jgi:hypothetical protein
MHPTTELELCLVLLPDDISYCENALKMRRRLSSAALRNAELIIAIGWLRVAQTQLALAQRAAAHLAKKQGGRQ